MTGGKARKFACALRKRLQEVGQAPVAQSVGVDVSVISRLFSDGRVDQFCAVVEALEMKLVPSGYACIRAEELEHVMYWARRGMDSIKSAADLVYEDDE